MKCLEIDQEYTEFPISLPITKRRGSQVMFFCVNHRKESAQRACARAQPMSYSSYTHRGTGWALVTY